MVEFKDKISILVASSVLFIFSIILLGEYDYTLPLFFLVTIFLTFKIKTRNSSLFYFGILYFLVYLGMSVLLYDYFAVFSAFLSSFSYLLVMLVVGNSKVTLKPKNYSLLIKLVIGFDFLLAAFLVYRNGTLQADFNSHPVGGALSVAILPLIIHYYFNTEGKQIERLAVVFIASINIILSGIRGYYMIGGFTVITLLIIDFLNNEHKIKYFAVVAGVATFGLAFILFFTAEFANIIDVLGVFNTLGRRHYEFTLLENVMEVRGVLKNIIGDGFGLAAGVKYPDAAFTGTSYDEVTTNTSLVYHNSYISIMYIFGYLGLFLYFAYFGYVIYKIIRMKADLKITLPILAYVISFLISLYFRRTFFRGILEMSLLLIVINTYLYKRGEES